MDTIALPFLSCSTGAFRLATKNVTTNAPRVFTHVHTEKSKHLCLEISKVSDQTDFIRDFIRDVIIIIMLGNFGKNDYLLIDCNGMLGINMGNKMGINMGNIFGD